MKRTPVAVTKRTATDIRKAGSEYNDEDVKPFSLKPVNQYGKPTKRIMYARLYRQDHDELFVEAGERGEDSYRTTRDAFHKWMKTRWQELELDEHRLNDSHYMNSKRSMVLHELNAAAATTEYGNTPPYSIKAHQSGTYEVWLGWKLVEKSTDIGLESLSNLSHALCIGLTRLSKTAEMTYDLSHLEARQRGKAEQCIEDVRNSVGELLGDVNLMVSRAKGRVVKKIARFNDLAQLELPLLAEPDPTDQQP